MAMNYNINIYSNNGQTTLASYSLEDSYKMTIYITEKGVEQDGAKLPSILYSYDGSGTFEGVALTADNSKADYAVKSDFTVSDSDVDLYIVESSGVKAPSAGYCVVYVDNTYIEDIYSDISNYFLITTLGIEQWFDGVTELVVYTASAEISGMEIATGSNPTYVGTVINVGETIGNSIDATYDYHTIGSQLGDYYALYLAPVYAPASNDYTITQTLTNITSDSATITITPDTGYTLPSSITVSGATLTSYNSSTGVAVLSSMTSSVSVSVECEEEIVEKPYLTFSSPNTFTLAVANSTKNWDGTLEYSTDTTTWSTWDGTSAVSAGSDGTQYNLYMRGSNNTVINSAQVGYFVVTGSSVDCSGNIENLLDYQTVLTGNQPTMSTYCFSWLFYNCTALISAPELPSTTLGNGCYYSMFNGCSNLVTGPSSLPATSLSILCYMCMFQNCTSLQNVPDMTVNTLPSFVYQNYGVCAYMFYGCSLITDASNIRLNATTLYDYCYSCMFQGCTSLISAPSLPATTLVRYCYSNMFYGCTSLTSIPALPATTLANYCYLNMFYRCISIKLSTTQTGEYQTPYRIPTSGTGTDATNALGSMFTNTGGTFTGTPVINTTYYTSNTVIPATTS